MSMKSFARIVVAAGILIAPIANAHAYKLTFDSVTGKWSGVCADGHQWVIGNGTTQPTQSQAETICAKHGGFPVASDDDKPASTKQKAVRGK